MSDPRGEYIYHVNDLYSCVQGEGAMTGEPMILVRLQGCPVGCAFCDTKETWPAAQSGEAGEVQTLHEALGTNGRWCRMTAPEIVRAVIDRAPTPRFVLVTGGEPCMHRLEPLVDALHAAHFNCALETSGTYPVTGEFDWVTVSPKRDQPGGLPLDFSALNRAHEIKQVVGKPEDLERLAELLRLLEKPPMVVSVQPVWGSSKALGLCYQAALLHGWRLSLQTHKWIEAR